MSNNLFDEFGPVSSKLWKQKIQYELKGADYNATLVWESPEGIKVKPFYHIDEAKDPITETVKTEPFKIGQDIFVKDADKSATRAANTVKRGAEAIRFTVTDATIDAEKLIAGINPAIPVYFYLHFLSIDFVKKIDAIAKDREGAIYVQPDPIGRLAKEGNWYTSLNEDFAKLNTIALTCKNISFIGINAGLYQNAGANSVQQIAYTLAHVNEYFNRVTNISQPIILKVAVGTNYFFEIAKLRALRLLFNLIAKEYGHNHDCHIIATPTKRNKTIYDYNVNMLRTTTECMSAILGGADTVINLPYDALYHKSNEFGERIARNQLLVLKHESYFDKVNNPADGAYYIEELTQQLADKALTLFKDIEANGGFITQLKEGTIQRKIQESAAKEQELFDSGKEVLLGTNKYPNKNDRMAHDMQLFPFLKINPRKTLVSPIIEKRLAEKTEQERLENEKVSNKQ
ncbi:methylmalonyl-CoA mutase [Flavobacterium rivuli WB 3.3-2 = DSM 21788]|uniref:Methylmalonyl-CoA mutase n=1 Tax=Flavobacterium rivuli WB 3.3-2 = DSM 21788 TaxID=1121895 RepID=A0A0A2M4D3_9FLAO|nr:methylmalonyl-CoA mutase subunit beta [Flavobacterium rivuli]KGO86313.1 methylmalonyl-CoA mutase [Flavobacterium rivuli WB 3.3-2 = DSM 21788]